MKTKEEIIKEAWGVHYFTDIDENGFVNYSEFNKCYTNQYVGDYWEKGYNAITKKHWVRPKSLQGIETNNNWTKIESESDLPKDKTTQYSVCKDKKVFQSTVNCGTVINWYNIGKISHYQPITKPEPPLH